MDQDHSDKKINREYKVEFYGEILEETTEIYHSISVIINFFMQYIDRLEILGYVL